MTKEILAEKGLTMTMAMKMVRDKYDESDENLDGFIDEVEVEGRRKRKKKEEEERGRRKRKKKEEEIETKEEKKKK